MRKALRIKMNEKYKKTEFAEGKFISDRSAGVMSEPNPLKAVRRVLRDKERAGISKGAGLATEARSLLIFSHETMRKPDKGRGKPF